MLSQPRVLYYIEREVGESPKVDFVGCPAIDRTIESDVSKLNAGELWLPQLFLVDDDGRRFRDLRCVIQTLRAALAVGWKLLVATSWVRTIAQST